MINFEFLVPTKVIFGKGTENKAADEIKAFGAKKVLVHYGSGSVKRSGLLDRVLKSLDDAGIAHIELGGVVPNPRLGLVREGIALAKKEGVDFILAIGGGSAIDSAKAIGYGLTNDCDVWDIYEGKAQAKACTPIGVILTIAASGSETSNSTVLTNEDGWLKRSGNSEYCRPKFAIMNPELTYTLPAYQTASGGTDIMMHTMERYFTTVDHVELIDRISEGLLKTVIHNLPIALAQPNNYDARAELMWAGSLSHNGLTGTGRVADFACHQLEHELGGLFDVAHGAGLAAVWGSWARYVLHTDVNRFAQYAVNVMNCDMDFSDPEKTALEGIAATERFFQSIGMPISVSDMGITLTDEQIDEMARKCTFFGRRKIGNFQKLDYEDIVAIYQAAR